MPRLAVKLLVLVFILAASCKNQPKDSVTDSTGKHVINVPYGTPVLDGSGSDDVWVASDWEQIDQPWIGDMPGKQDFSGQYKLAWDENNLYVLAEITDDSLLEIHSEGAEGYWGDDCLELFVDEDNSGGIHQYNYNAFAYHISLDGRVMDMTPDSSYHFFDDHCLTRVITREHTSTWEIAVRIFDGQKFSELSENVPKLLKAGKKMGFALAYNDIDNSSERSNCIGSVPVPAKEKTNAAWVDAGVFGQIALKQ